MLNNCQWERLLRNLAALNSLLENRIHRAHQDSPNDERIRCLYEQRLEVQRLLAWLLDVVASQLAVKRWADDESPLSSLQRSPLASECWTIFAEHMPLSAYILAGDCGCAGRDEVSPCQMMLPF
jgi:hypothetical protein